MRIRAASFVDPHVILRGLHHLRPELTRRLAAVDATQAKLTDRVPPLGELLELDLIRSVLQAHLSWLTRTEKALAREILLNEREVRANDDKR